MREILVISGKGGTGKTSLTAAFAHLAAQPLLCDLDVDAPDLHLLLAPVQREIHAFRSGREARILSDQCTDCGECSQRCRFDAMHTTASGPAVDPLKCEGCGVCVQFCPSEAIAFEEKQCGQWYRSDTRFGPMIHAQLRPAEENSGKLVTLLRQQARSLAQNRGLDMVLCDGPPGIGCPVISSLSGVSVAVIVTEPTPAGRHDLERVADLCGYFRVPAGVVVNKWDLNPLLTRKIEKLSTQRQLQLLGRIPFDPAFTDAMVDRQTITEFQPDGLGRQVRQAWQAIFACVENNQKAAELSL